MKKVKLAYFGTPDFSARFLEKLLEDKDIPVEVKFVVTQPDERAGRKQIFTPSPVKIVAQQYNIPVQTDLTVYFTPGVKQIDLALLFAYGKIIPKDILDVPKYGFWNVHPSLLPKYRGPSPVATPLINGDIETGVTIIKLDEEMDHGPILAQEKTYIFPLWRRDQLMEHLVDVGFKLIKNLLLRYADDLSRVVAIEQDHKKATYTKLLKKEDGFIEISNFKVQISNSPKKLFNLYRGLYPWPGIWTTVRVKGKEKRLKITKMHWENEQIVIKKVQLEGKNEVDFTTFTKAYPKIF